MPAGYLSLHADLLVHGSQPNHSSRRRCGAEIKTSFYRYPFVQKKRSFCQDRLGTSVRQVAEAEGVSVGFTLRYCASDCMPVGWGIGTEEQQGGASGEELAAGRPKGYGGQAILCRGEPGVW